MTTRHEHASHPTGRPAARLVRLLMILACAHALLALPAASAQTEDNNALLIATGTGGQIRLEFKGWEDRDSAVRAAESVKTLFRNELIEWGPLEVVLIDSRAAAGYDEAQRTELKSRLLQGTAVLAEGAEKNLAAVLDLPVIDESDAAANEIVGVMVRDGKAFWAHFKAATRVKRIPGSGAEAPGVTGEPEIVVTMNDVQARTALLGQAFEWLASDPRIAGGAAPREGALLLQGAWAAITPGGIRWTWAGGDHRATGEIANVLTVTLEDFKIGDAFSDKDWYLADLTVHHETNYNNRYAEHVPFCTHGDVGWYTQDRFTKIEREGAYAGWYFLEDYGPTGTISSSTVSYEIGANISPEPGVSGSYSDSYTQESVSITDQSSMLDHYGQWWEDFYCPHGGYGGYPSWHHPCNNSKGSFYSTRAIIYRTARLLDGARLTITQNAGFWYDDIDWPWYCFCACVSVTRWCYTDASNTCVGLGAPVTARIFTNHPPDKPDTPSVRTPLWVNDSAIVTVAGTDEDGDTLAYRFDFGDGQESPYGAPIRTYAWAVPGEMGVRARAQDSPHGAQSVWSDTFLVSVRGLDHVEVTGPAELNDNGSAPLQCTAFLSDGATSDVTDDYPSGWENGTIVWSVDSAYAAISEHGRLTALDAGGQNRTVNVTATYTLHGTTRVHSLPVTIVETLADPCVFDEDFADGTVSGDPEWTVYSGAWSVTGDLRWYESAFNQDNAAIVGDALEHRASGRIELQVKLTSKAQSQPNGAIIFGGRDSTTFRYVRLKPGKIQIGQMGQVDGSDNAGVKKTVSVAAVAAGKWLNLRLELSPAGRVDVYLGSAKSPKASYTFTTPWEGDIGVWAKTARTRFDNVMIFKGIHPHQ